MNVPDAPVYHLALPEDWAAAFASGEYHVSTRGMSLDEVGFIHCSRRDQLERTAGLFYDDVSQLVVLTIDPARVPAEIVHEPPEPGGDELFPHIYGPLPVDAVALTHFWLRGDDGWRLADL